MIGVGGLGIYAVQFLRLLTGARIVAVDSSEARLKLARDHGADNVVSSGPDASAQIRELSGGIGATFVLDCVGVNATLATAVAALSWRGRLAMVGAGGGFIPFDFFKVPPGAQLVTSLNGGSIALMEVVEMAALGRLKVLVDHYPLSAAKQAYDDFEHGRLVGRAVLTPAPLELEPATAQPTRHARLRRRWPARGTLPERHRNSDRRSSTRRSVEFERAVQLAGPFPHHDQPQPA